MRFLNFSSRNRKEILRDPLSLVFGIGFPVIMLALFSVLSNSIQGMPKEIFSISNFAPDMVVFGLSFKSGKVIVTFPKLENSSKYT